LRGRGYHERRRPGLTPSLTLPASAFARRRATAVERGERTVRDFVGGTKVEVGRAAYRFPNATTCSVSLTRMVQIDASVSNLSKIGAAAAGAVRSVRAAMPIGG